MRIRFLLFVCALWMSIQCLRLEATTFTIGDADIAAFKAAIAASNTNGLDDTIILTTNSSYVFTAANGGLGGAALPSIAPDGGHTLTIIGNGALIGRTHVNGTPNFRLLHIQSGANVTIQGFLEFDNGNSGNAHGGGIYVDGETAPVRLTVLGCHFGSCSADYGGAIYVDAYNDPSVPAHTATLIVHDTGFSNNAASQYGGAIWNDSGGFVMELTGCSFVGNSATRSAGAVQCDGSNGTAICGVANSTFSQNSAGDFSGALGVDGFSGSAIVSVVSCEFDQNSAQSGGVTDMDGTSGNANVTFVNCTLSGNTATAVFVPNVGFVGGGGGGIELDGGNGGTSILNVASSTFTGNSANFDGGADVYVNGTGAGSTNLQIGNTILNSDTTGNNLVTKGTGSVTSQGFNLSSDDVGGGAGTGPGGLLNHAGDIRNTDPLLDPAGLKGNGGLTATIALQATSPAIDHGRSDVVSGATVDQRGEPRPYDDSNVSNAAGSDASDIGAYEADVRIVRETKSGTTLSINFASVLGRDYEVQSRPGLNSGMWSSVTTTSPVPPIPGTGGIVSVNVPNAVGGPGSGFYRLHQLP